MWFFYLCHRKHPPNDQLEGNDLPSQHEVLPLQHEANSPEVTEEEVDEVKAGTHGFKRRGSQEDNRNELAQ